MGKVEEGIRPIAEKAASELGYELYDVEYKKEGSEWYLRIFIDKSVVEVFLNDKMVCAARAYPTKEDASGVSVRAVGEGIRMEALNAYSIKPLQN